MTPREQGSSVPAREILRCGALAAALVLAGAVLYHGPGIASGSRVFFTHDVSHSDIWHLNFPFKQLYDRALAAGHLPLWCPELGTGFPLLAQGQVGALYPINLLLYGALPVVPAFNWGVLLHAALAGAFAAMLARQLGAGRAGSLLAGVVFAFCGFFVVHVKHVAMTAAAVWAPLLLLFVERFARSRGARHLVALAACTGTLLLAGHPQIAYYALLVTGAWAAVLVARAERRLGLAAGMLWAVVLGAGLAAPQLLPTQELTAVGPRHGGLSVEEATEWRYHWSHLVLFLRPHAFGDPAALRERPLLDPGGSPQLHPVTGEPLRVLSGFEQVGEGKSLFWEVTGYVGVLPLLLAVAALVLGWRRRSVLMPAGLLVVSLLLALGPGGGLFWLFWRFVPGWAYFRFQSRFLLFADLALALLAGLGLTLVLERARPAPFARWRPAACAVVVALCWADLYLALGDHNATVDAARWLAPPPSATRIASEEAGRSEPFRIVGNDTGREVFLNAYFRARGWQGDPGPYEDAKAMLAPNLSAIYGLQNMEFFFPLYPQWMGDAVRLIGAPARLEDSREPRPPGRLHAGFASLFNVRYLLDAFGFDAPGFSPLASYPGGERYPGGVVLEPPVAGLPPFEIRLLANRGAFPRAFLVPGARFVRDEPTRPGTVPAPVRALFAPDFDPRREVSIVLAPGEEPPPATPPGAPLGAAVEIVRYLPDEVRLRAVVPRPCWLVLSDTFYPGWTAQVNGAERTIRRANVSMRALRLEPGPAEIVFRYAPASFRRGRWLALLALALTATLPLQLRFARSRVSAAALLVLLASGCGGGPAEPPAGAVFDEITAEVGLDAAGGEPWPDGTYFLPEIMGPGLALFDADGDGDLELLQLRTPRPGSPGEPAPNRLWRRDDSGRFSDVTARAGLGDPGFGQGVAVADADNDGDLDVYFANYGRDALYVNAGDGSFAEATAGAGIDDDDWSAAATFCDYDRDGRLDLYVAHYLRVDYGGVCRSSAGVPDYCGPATFDGVADRLWHNEGDGSFRDVSAAAGIVPADGGKRAKGLGVICLDLTGDGWPDFYVANDGEANHLWVNGADGTFTEQAVARGLAVNRHGRAEASMGIAVGDADGDGRIDLLLSHLALENNTLYRGSGRFFMDRTVEAGMSGDDLAYTGFGCALFDYDHDGDLDFAVVNGEVRGVSLEAARPAGPFWRRYAEPNLLFDNDGKGDFELAATRAGAFATTIEVSRGLALGDLDGDGDLDLALSNVDNTLRVYRNRAPAAGSHHLLVRALTGERDAIGALVTVVTATRRFVAPVLPGAGYQSSSDPRVHFGLGAADAVERVEVAWPDGRREAFRVEGVDREVVLRQGAGAATEDE